MMSGDVRTLHTADELPEAWDRAASGNVFLSTGSLVAIEKAHPCGQAYHIAEANGSCSICVTYRHSLDLLTYGPGSLSIPVTMIGIPCSVASPGYHLEPDSAAAMIQHLRRIRGGRLVLNSTDTSPLPGFSLGSTLPSCKLSVRWGSFEEYLGAMRSHYRYRARKALSRWKTVTAHTISDNSDFGNDLYTLYLSVFNRSRYKLEKLGIEFFRIFPARIDRFDAEGRPIGFVQTIRGDDELAFMFGGLDYSANAKYDTYLNALLHIVRIGIEAGCSFVDLGQTAEDIKCKLGCVLARRTLRASHSNRFADLLIRVLTPALSYRVEEHEYRVFR
jgi:hypothetical protein